MTRMVKRARLLSLNVAAAALLAQGASATAAPIIKAKLGTASVRVEGDGLDTALFNYNFNPPPGHKLNDFTYEGNGSYSIAGGTDAFLGHGKLSQELVAFLPPPGGGGVIFLGNLGKDPGIFRLFVVLQQASFSQVTTGFLSTSFTPFITAQADIYANYSLVPEPATWGMLIFGFASVGALLRRKRLRFALPEGSSGDIKGVAVT